MDKTDLGPSELLALVGKMKVYDLEFDRFQGMPTLPVMAPGYLYQLHRQHQTSYDPQREGPRTGASGMIIMSDHSGTHIDALCHQAMDQRIHGDVAVGPGVQTPWGFKVHGSEEIQPMIRKGVLLDIPASKGSENLPEKYQVTKEDLESSLAPAGAEISKGDVALVRTGYGRFWNEPAKYMGHATVSKEASRWLGDKEVFAVGIDNSTWDPLDVRDPVTKLTAFGHVNLLVERGIYIMENLFLEQLSADRCHSFLFLAFPIKLKGATASPVRPVALGQPGA
jgi:kynurenine formamidase